MILQRIPVGQFLVQSDGKFPCSYFWTKEELREAPLGKPGGNLPSNKEPATEKQSPPGGLQNKIEYSCREPEIGVVQSAKRLLPRANHVPRLQLEA